METLSLESLLVQARAAQDIRDFAKGAELFRKACDMDSTCFGSWYGLGDCLVNDPAAHRPDYMDRLQGRVKCYHRAIELDPMHASAHFSLGRCLSQVGDSGAEQEFRRVIKLDPVHADAHFHLACILQDTDDLEDAEQNFRKAIEIDPKHLDAHFYLGEFLLNIKGELGSEKYFRVVIELDPNHMEAHVILAKNLYCEGDLDGAEKMYRWTIEIHPSILGSHRELATVLKAKANALEASCGDPKEVGRLLIEAAKHWETELGLQSEDVTNARAKAARLLSLK